VVSISVAGVELETSCTAMLKSWNHSVHLWLNNYVFERTFPKGGRPTLVNNLVVYFISAFWHGFYPAYYVMFFQMAFLAELSKDIYRMRSKFAFIPWPVGTVVANIATMVLMNYQGTIFGLLGLDELKQLAISTNYFWYWLVFPAFFVVRFSGIASVPRKKKVE